MGKKFQLTSPVLINLLNLIKLKQFCWHGITEFADRFYHL